MIIIIITQGVPWLENDKMSLDTNWWVRCWATRRNEMCTTDLARRGLKPTMGVEEEEVTNVFVILIIFIIVGILSILHYIIILICRVTQWLHVPRGPNKNVPTIFRDFQPLRELLQHAWHGLQSTPGDLSFLRRQYFCTPTYFTYFLRPCIFFLTKCHTSWPGFLQRWPRWWDGYGWSFRRVGSSSYCLLATVSKWALPSFNLEDGSAFFTKL